ncbi:hypothetical protein ACFU6S_02515 [Streptomyces sp. NPDC057456]|uniref:hypothetical protein n=1 Tax=Streptomyces sp. NPDC057456 TaxID=3346139 RepID=UPI0036D0FDA9
MIPPPTTTPVTDRQEQPQPCPLGITAPVTDRQELLPLELGFGSGQTCWRRLDRWQQAGVLDRSHRILLAALNAVGELDWNRACVDGSHVRAKERETRPVRRRSTDGRLAANTI